MPSHMLIRRGRERERSDLGVLSADFVPGVDPNAEALDGLDEGAILCDGIVASAPSLPNAN